MSLVDKSQGASFDAYVAALQRPDGSLNAEAHAITRNREAAAAAQQFLADSLHIPETFKLATRRFRTEQIARMRLRQPYDKDLQLGLIRWAREIALALFRRVVDGQRNRLGAKNLRPLDTFVFRYALCIVLLYTRWVAGGQQTGRRPERFANDVVDMHVAAMSTFFGGVLTADETLSDIATEVRFLLRTVGAYIG